MRLRDKNYYVLKYISNKDILYNSTGKVCGEKDLGQERRGPREPEPGNGERNLTLGMENPQG